MATPVIPPSYSDRYRRYVDVAPGPDWHNHANEWHRFIIMASDLREASDYAADLGLWLHCWSHFDVCRFTGLPYLIDLWALPS